MDLDKMFLVHHSLANCLPAYLPACRPTCPLRKMRAYLRTQLHRRCHSMRTICLASGGVSF